MKKTLALALAACLFLSGTVFALPAELSEAVRLFSYDGKTVYGLFNPKDGSTALYTAEGETASRLCGIENSMVSSNDYAVVGDKAYCCFGDSACSGAVRLMRIGLKDGSVAKAAEFQCPNASVYLEPAGEKLLLYNRRYQTRAGDAASETVISLYDPATGALKPAVELKSPDGEEWVITAATYDQGGIFALVERIKGGQITYTLRKYAMDGEALEETSIPTALAAPGGRGALKLSVSGDYVKINNVSDSILFRRSTLKKLYDGPLLILDGEDVYSDPTGARYRLDLAAGTLTRISGPLDASETVEAYIAMVETLAKYNEQMVSPALLAFDTTHMAFASGEKEQFFARMRARFPESRVMDATLDDLEKLGYLDVDGAFRSMKYGTLVTIQGLSFENNVLKYSISNFVSGQSGHVISGASLQKKDGAWAVKEPGLRGIA